LSALHLYPCKLTLLVPLSKFAAASGGVVDRGSVDSQNWRTLRATALTGQAGRSDWSSLYNSSRFRIYNFVLRKSFINQLVNGYVFPGLYI